VKLHNLNSHRVTDRQMDRQQCVLHMRSGANGILIKHMHKVLNFSFCSCSVGFCRSDNSFQNLSVDSVNFGEQNYSLDIIVYQGEHKFNWRNFHISRRFQEGFPEKSRTCLHCFGLLCNVPNLLVCLNIEQTHDMHNTGAVAKIKRATSFLNRGLGLSDPVHSFIMTGNQCSQSSTFYTKISTRTIQIQGDYQDFQL